MSRRLGDYLRELRQQRGLSQARMGDLLGMAGKAYQRIELGAQHHHGSTLELLDAALIGAGFDWHDGLAAELDHEQTVIDIDQRQAAIIERLERIERVMLVLVDRLERMGHDAELVTQISNALGELAARREATHEH